MVNDRCGGGKRGGGNERREGVGYKICEKDGETERYELGEHGMR